MPRLLTCEALLFDLDGVLVDSRRCIERHWARWSTAHGLPFEDVIAVAHGRRTAETIRLVAPHLDAEEEAARLTRAEETDTSGVTVMPGAFDILSSLPPTQWAVVTSGTRTMARTRLTHCQLPLPPVLVTADDITTGKPAPDGYLVASDQLGVGARRAVVFEDTAVGVAAGLAAGAMVVGIAAAGNSAELSDAAIIVDTLTSLAVRATGTDPQWQFTVASTS